MIKHRKEVFWLVRDKYDGQVKDLAAFAVDLERLKKGEPIDYVIGWREFLGCHIDLSFRPLIPRTETEYWVENMIEEVVKEKRKKIKCLDVFAGSGCIGLALLKHLPMARVDLAEKNKKIIKQIKLNLKLNKIKNRAKVFESDIFSKVKGKYDYIFANPPYIPAKRKLPKSVIDWEPKEALFGATKGLFFVEKFLKQAKKHLMKDGVIYLEFDTSQKSAINKILTALKYKTWRFEKDQFNRWRHVKISI